MRHTCNPFDVVAIGASLGGLEALTEILSKLPTDFPAAIILVQHTGEHSHMAPLLEKITRLPVQWAAQGDDLQPSRVYVAPPGSHLIVNRNRMLSLTSTPKVNFVRPSVDVLFKSVATAYSQRAIGVVLTGMLSDGAKGAQEIQRCGGRVIVQHPESAQAPGMPRAALNIHAAHFVLPLEHIASALITLTMVRGATSVFNGTMPYFY
jgi:two-component system chemotaxis response regulator CheB